MFCFLNFISQLLSYHLIIPLHHCAIQFRKGCGYHLTLLNFHKRDTTKPFMLGKGGSGEGHICSLIIYDYYHVTRPSKQMNALL